VTSVVERPPAEAFANRQLERAVQFGQEGQRIFGYVAEAGTCHVDFRHACVTPPQEPDYDVYNRYPTEVDGGVTLAGRIAVGYGRFAGRCGCCSVDDHACLKLDAGQAMAHYDQMDTVARVRVGRDNIGLWFSGVWADDATEDGRAVIARRGMSGDWRRIGGNLRLVDVMGVSVGTPGFPVGRYVVASGQSALVAAGRAGLVTDPAVGQAATVALAPGTPAFRQAVNLELRRQLALQELGQRLRRQDELRELAMQERHQRVVNRLDMIRGV